MRASRSDSRTPKALERTLEEEEEEEDESFLLESEGVSKVEQGVGGAHERGGAVRAVQGVREGD